MANIQNCFEIIKKRTFEPLKRHDTRRSEIQP